MVLDEPGNTQNNALSFGADYLDHFIYAFGKTLKCIIHFQRILRNDCGLDIHVGVSEIG